MGTVVARETRLWRGHVLVLLASAEGYVMVRIPDCIPFVMGTKEWDKLKPSPAKA